MGRLSRNEDLYPQAGDMGWLRDLADGLMEREAAPQQIEHNPSTSLPATSEGADVSPPESTIEQEEFTTEILDEGHSETDIQTQADQKMQARVNDISAKIVSVNENLANIDKILSPTKKLWNLFGTIGGGDTVEKLLGKLGKGSEQFRQIAQTITPFLQHLATLRTSLQGITANKQFFPTIHQQAGAKEISLEKIAKNINERQIAELYRQIGSIIGIVVQQGAMLKTIFESLTEEDIANYPALGPLKNAFAGIEKAYDAFNGSAQNLAYASGDQAAVQQLKSVAPEKGTASEVTPDVAPNIAQETTTEDAVGEQAAGQETADTGQLKSSLKDLVERFAENISPAVNRPEEHAIILQNAINGMDSLVDTMYRGLTGEAEASVPAVAEQARGTSTEASIQEFDLNKFSLKEFDLKENE